MTTPSASPSPRPHQVDALTDLVRAFAVHDRVQLRMACGTGKTLVGRWHAEASDARQVLVLVPSLALLTQTLQEWRRARGWPFEALVVCSDPTTSAGAAERSGGDEVDDEALEPDWSTVRASVTTDPAAAARFLERARSDRPQVVLSTYHSAPVVAAAQAASGAVFDLVVADEAHRLAGTPREEFRAALAPRQVVARRRLFMTATPRTGGPGACMDDPTVFGVLAHTVTFGDAIRAGLLTDYQVLVVAGRDHEASAGGSAPSTVPAAVFDAADTHGVRRVLSFHGRVAKARAFADVVDGTTTPAGVPVAARHVHGAMPTAQRAAALAWLGQRDDAQLRVVSNARVLTEGVDVPAVDAVCFADERSSVVDIVQAVGRVLRPSPGKRIGSIIVPVTLPSDVDDDSELLVSRFSVLWAVLRGLRAHDQRFASETDAAVRAHARHGRHGYRPTRIHFTLPADVDEDVVHLRLVQEVGDAWERFYAACEDWCWSHPTKRLPRGTRHQGLGIGEWAVTQRAAHHRGVLPADRARRLERLPGWFWDRADAAWSDTYSLLEAFAAAHGSVAEAPSGTSVFDGLRAAPPQRELMGPWLACQRRAHRQGTLDPERARLLEQLPGWTWTPLTGTDTAMVDALEQFVAFEKTADVPSGHLEDGLPLGRWVWDVRRRKLTGTLPPALEDEIWAATPSRWARGHRLRWQWDKPETQWRLAFTALRAYADREGHAGPPTSHREELHDGRVNLGQWVALQRHERRHGRLDDDRAAALDALPGWTWDGDVGGTTQAQPPLQLPDHLEHGGAGAIARGCHCETCLTARRASNNDWNRRRREQAAAAGVDQRRARTHLLQLEGQLAAAITAETRSAPRPGTGRTLVVAASGVPLGVLRQLAAGTLPGLSRDHDALIRATTVKACLSHRGAHGSRGRGRSAANATVPAGPTWATLHDLQQRGFTRGWIGRELGYANGLQVDRDRVTRRMAQQVQDLADRLDGHRLPPGPRNRTQPTLAELTARATPQEARP